MATLLLPKHAKAEYIASKNRVTTMRGEFEKVAFKGNTSGRKALGDAVLVRPDEAVTQSAGGVEIPDEYRERSALAAESGVLVDVGEDAFRWNRSHARMGRLQAAARRPRVLRPLPIQPSPRR
jgi:hypothetical protein